MRLILSLDYEVFFGAKTGSVEKTLIEPTRALSKVASRFAAPLVFFVDAGFLIRLRERKDDAGRSDYSKVRNQLDELVKQGHEIQLHIHPHWEDSVWDGTKWVIDTNRYRLHDHSPEAIRSIVKRYKNELDEVAGSDNVFAFRAGGWVLQPFADLRESLWDAGIWLDSTVYRGGLETSETHSYDFRGAPAMSRWWFDDDPLLPSSEGRFLEVPIASYRLPPSFYWQLAWFKKFGSARHRSFGDGSAIPLGRNDLAAKLFKSTYSVVSMDGFKASFISRAVRNYQVEKLDDFVVIGHPKALSEYSLDALEKSLSHMKQVDFVGYSFYRQERSARTQVLE
ncbi:polysaccharide deacetylase family protein [Ferribacterium limneticum]|uniref:hypothetical protein n=1 Tax=Ferribacterium limneticum TaxID=76259 RepID=UPI001CFA4427|nr:hypothetical protein [Ferribacterium limneticum]UCV29975.1 hypothetical protein KI617_07825 [Ferribacterium limneticum]UCV33894.1 hypothetical protein KI608_07825 [Ferribacterium limneticum]